MTQEHRTLILLSWCHGLGAQRLASSLYKSIKSRNDILVCSDPWNELGIDSIEIKLWSRKISRLFALFRKYNFEYVERVLVFADVPLRIRNTKQIVYFHNLDIINGKGLKNWIYRYLIRQRKNCTYIVQTTRTRAALQKITKSTIYVSTPPIVSSTIEPDHSLQKEFGPYLYYPARNYPHKNIEWLASNYQSQLFKLMVNKKCDSNTLEKIIPIGEVDNLINENLIRNSVGIIIASSYESLCMPILEAIKYRKPIIAPKLEYVEEFLEMKEAYFYQHLNKKSLLEAILELENDFQINRLKTSAKHLASDWSEFLRLLLKI